MKYLMDILNFTAVYRIAFTCTSQQSWRTKWTNIFDYFRCSIMSQQLGGRLLNSIFLSSFTLSLTEDIL